jgi:plasmid stabilization system protein ParE
MARLLKIRARAYQELDEKCERIAQFNKFAANRFLQQVEKTFQFLLDFPVSGSLCEYEGVPAEGLRFISVQKYKSYIIVFRPIPTGIEIVHVFHGSQDIEGILRGELGD